MKTREEIMLALRLCTDTPCTERCPKNCPYLNTDGCIMVLLKDTFDMVKESNQWKELYHA